MTKILNSAQVRLLHAVATLLEHEGVMIHVDRAGPLTPEGLIEEVRRNRDSLDTFVDLSLRAYDLTVSREITVGEMVSDPLELIRIMVSLREHFVQYPGLEG